MWRSKKVIILAVLVAVLLFGTLGGVALANSGDENDTQPEIKCEAFLDKVCELYDDDIDCGKLKTAFAEAKSQMQGEMPERIRARMMMGAGVFQCLVDEFDVDPDELKTALIYAKKQIQAGADPQEVMVEVIDGLGIDLEELKATCGRAADGERPFKRGFHGMGRMRIFGKPCIPAE